MAVLLDESSSNGREIRLNKDSPLVRVFLDDAMLAILKPTLVVDGGNPTSQTGFEAVYEPSVSFHYR